MSSGKKSACFITLEGIEGAGKSSQVDNIRKQLEAAGKAVRTTREPGGTALAEGLRALLLNHQLQVTPEAELLMMFAARSSHIQEVIRPALQAGEWVLCDRFTDASYAYQGGGRGISNGVIRQMEDFVQQDLQPDLTLLFDIDVELGLARASARSDADRFEREEVEFFERIRRAYLARATERPVNYVIIDASQEFAAVSEQVHEVIAGYLERHAD